MFFGRTERSSDRSRKQFHSGDNHRHLNHQLVFLIAVSTIAMLIWLAGSSATYAQDMDEQLFQPLSYRSIGPFRGGRSAAVTGVPDRPMEFYFGAAGGGVWKTDDGGATWDNISDGFFGGSIGAVALAPSDPKTMYVGGGECTVRGNVSHGDGVWKSTDGGKNWVHCGLDDSRHIPRIVVHPDDPNVVYATALGHLYGPNEQRGVFRTVDGGQTWERVLFVNDEVGAFEIVMEPGNPRVLYASTWRIKRSPYSLESGGAGSGLWKSTDGGDSWNEITENPGLPQGTVGVIGIAVSPANPDRVWAIVESQKGGVFRSENGGESWTKTNEERNLRQRAWYYTRIYADPANADVVYVLNVGFYRSKDGGATFESIRTPHGDHHDLWIDPQDSDRMIIGDDGGGQVTFNGGRTWSTMMNQPTSQFYRVTTDNHFPYRIYGAQQDNSTVRIFHRTNGRSIGDDDWESTAGGESGHIAPKPDDPEIVYGGSYGGYLERVDHRLGRRRNVSIWPDNPIGHGAGDGKYRFQWNFPIFYSPHDSNTLYAAGNVLFKTLDEGQSWIPISPDLSRNDPSKLGPTGGPITKDNTGVEYYCTIFAALESPHERDVLWAGTDDGLLHISRDGGENWSDVTPSDLPEWSQINSIEAHPFEAGGLYVAATRYKLDDFKPYLFKTTDYGKTWERIDDGIHRKHFTRVVRADPQRKGLLYAGTESGMYISFDDGKRWQAFQLNLPIVPITDLAIKDNDLIVATQGRSFWILDDLTLLHQLNHDLALADVHLFDSPPTYRMRGGSGRASATAGANRRGGVPVRFWLNEASTQERVQIEVIDGDGTEVQVWSTEPAEGETRLTVEAGINEIRWNMLYEGAESFPGMVLWAGGTQGIQAMPGTYQVKLLVGDREFETEVELVLDPRSDVSSSDLQAQFEFLIGTRDKVTEIHRAIKQIRDMREQIQNLVKRMRGNDDYMEVIQKAEAIIEEITAIEETLYQTKNESSQDPLNFPIRLNNRLSALIGVAASGDFRPTEQTLEVRDMLLAEIDSQLTRLQTLMANEIPSFNELVREKEVPAVSVGDDK